MTKEVSNCLLHLEKCFPECKWNIKSNCRAPTLPERSQLEDKQAMQYIRVRPPKEVSNEIPSNTK